ncbi:MAG TPA: hypothetical protein VER39_15870 [Nocardioidaceae bacterium]|nr:hypothetical protein [Nocardioidaceae bacterium]
MTDTPHEDPREVPRLMDPADAGPAQRGLVEEIPLPDGDGGS